MTLFLYFHTIKHLKPIQIYRRIWNKFPSFRISSSNLPKCRFAPGKWVKSIPRRQSYFPPDRFSFLNKNASVSQPEEWEHAQHNKLWLYNLHYFDDLNTANAHSRKDEHIALITRWINENQPGKGTGWEPFPLSLRIVNWIKWVLNGNLLNQSATDSLALQARHLRKRIEYHLLGNHLFENAKALVFAGLFFQGREADGWLNKGLKILKREIKEQVLQDGGHFERSPMYHSLVLEGLLDLINAGNAFSGVIDEPILSTWRELVLKMKLWLAVMCHPDEQISFFNDSSLGIAPDMNSLEAYAQRLKIEKTKSVRQATLHLKDSGFVRISRDPVFLFADVGTVGPNYIPGHAHAESLSFELSISRRRVFVNSGVSCYGTGPDRAYQRSTQAHNTVEVDGENSSEVWSGFRVARKAEIEHCKTEFDDEVDSVTASHKGYQRFKSIGNHSRCWKVSQNQIEVIDDVGGSCHHQVSIFYHLHPDVSVEQSGDSGCFRISSGDKTILTLCFQPDHFIEIRDTFYYPEFGRAVPNKTLVFNSVVELPAQFTSTITIH